MSGFRYKWRPNASQRKAFAEKMKDPEEKAAYEERKRFKHSYEGFKDRDFIPTKEQYDFCMTYPELFITEEEKDAVNQIIYGYGCNEKIHHQYIHIINEKRRNYYTEQNNKYHE